MTTFPLGSTVVAPSVRSGCDGEDRGHRLAVGVLVVAEPVDPLVAGGAAVVAGHVLEVVVDRQLGEADLLDLGRRGGHVDAGQAAEPGQEAEVLGLLLLDQPRRRGRPRGSAARAPSSGCRRSPGAALSSRPACALSSASAFSSSCESVCSSCSASATVGVQVVPGLALLAAVDHAVVEAAQAVELGLLEPLLGVEPLGLAAQPASARSSTVADLGVRCSARLARPALILCVDLVDLGLVLRPAAPASFSCSAASSLSRLDSWNSRWTCFQGRRWSAMIIQTIESSHRDRRDREDHVERRLASVRFLGCWHGRRSCGLGVSLAADRAAERPADRRSAWRSRPTVLMSDVEEVLGDRHQVFQVDRPAKDHLDRQAGHEQEQDGQRQVPEHARPARCTS